MPKTPTKSRTATIASPYSSPTKKSTPSRTAGLFSLPSFPSTPTKSPRKAASTSASPTKRGSTSTTNTPRASSSVNYKFNFGMHKGKSINEVPWSYIRWCIDEGVVAARPDLRAAVEEYQKQKSSPSTPSSPRKSQATSSTPRASTSTAAAESPLSFLSINQRRTQLKQTIPEWLYDECMAVLEEGEYDFMMNNAKLREKTLERLEKLEKMAKSDFPKQYPPRPPSGYTLPESSKSVEELRRVLSKCPKIRGSYRNPTEDEKKYLVFHYDGFSGEDWYTLSEDYEATIKRCLRDIEKEHGKGARQIANWEVRDKYAHCISGINYAGGGKNFSEYYKFVDESAHWLEK